MHQQIFVNLPIENMARSQAFFRALGYEFNPQFTNDQGACLVVGENLFVMLLVKSFYQTFTDKAIADARTTSEVLVCFSCQSRAEVDALVDKAVAAGGTTPARRRTWASCTRAALTTWTATPGSLCTWWTRARPWADGR